MKRILVNECSSKINEVVKLSGWVHKIRSLKSFSFVVLRDRTGLVQCVVSNSLIEGIKLESSINIIGKLVEGKNKLNDFEIQVEELELLSLVKDELPIQINSESLDISMETLLNNRVLSLRNTEINEVFKVKNLIQQGFREFLVKEGFMEINTPKIVSGGAEGGADIFRLDYFGNEAFLAQSPQFYKQMMVASGNERVFEIAPVFRAEKHSTVRHLNEYISMDLEMGFIESEEDIMDLEEQLLKYIFCKVKHLVEVPEIKTSIPRLRFSDALKILKSEYNLELENDLSPEAEKLLNEYAIKKYNSELIFITHYPLKKRPMYTMPFEETETRSFDLLFRGLEITTGGQRINNYCELLKGFEKKGINPQPFMYYIETFKWGVPPHGGLSIGLERITAQLLNIKNIREVTLFPRDKVRLTP